VPSYCSINCPINCSINKTELSFSLARVSLDTTVYAVYTRGVNAAQSFISKTKVSESMSSKMESMPFLLLVAIMQPLLFFISLDIFGLYGTALITTILILILILFVIWMRISGKNPFSSNEEE